MSERRCVVDPRTVLGGAIIVAGAVMSMSLLAGVPLPVPTSASPPVAAAGRRAIPVCIAGDNASAGKISHEADLRTHRHGISGSRPGAGTGVSAPLQELCVNRARGRTGAGASGSGKDVTKMPPRSFLFSPYKDVVIDMDWNTTRMRTAVTGTSMPVVGHGSLVGSVEPRLDAITLAAATGECGNENWGGVPGASFARVNVHALADAGVRYVVSTGGHAGTFTCSSRTGMTQFLARYLTPFMVGVDFDIEDGQSQNTIDNLISAAARAEKLHPNLRFSFTLATLAASDGSRNGVNQVGGMVIRSIQRAKLANYRINLMAMDFGAASSAHCVVEHRACNMGKSAIQAAWNLEQTYGVPAADIELTTMIGLNDTAGEVTQLGDIDTITRYAVDEGLAGVHFWSLDRDTPCAGAIGHASPTCNSVRGSVPLQYTDRFLRDLGR